jgi:hypothetical protein
MQWPVIRPSSPFPPPIFQLSSPNSLAKTQQTQFMLGSPIPHIRHHHSSIPKGISHYRQNLYLVGGLSPLARKARHAARCAPAASWPVAMILFSEPLFRISGPLELALSERDDFVDLQQEFLRFLAAFLGSEGKHSLCKRGSRATPTTSTKRM